MNFTPVPPHNLRELLKQLGIEVERLEQLGLLTGRQPSSDPLDFLKSPAASAHSPPAEPPQEQQQQPEDGSDIEALAVLMQNAVAAIQRLIARFVNAILRALQIEQRVGLMDFAQVSSRATQAPTEEVNGLHAAEALKSVVEAIKNNDASSLPQAAVGDSQATADRAELAAVLHGQKIAAIPEPLDSSIELARRAVTQDLPRAKNGQRAEILGLGKGEIFRVAAGSQLDPADVQTEIVRLQLEGAQDIERVAEKFDMASLSHQAHAMAINAAVSAPEATAAAHSSMGDSLKGGVLQTVETVLSENERQNHREIG